MRNGVSQCLLRYDAKFRIKLTSIAKNIGAIDCSGLKVLPDSMDCGKTVMLHFLVVLYSNVLQISQLLKMA